MTSELLHKGVVLKLFFSFFLGKFGLNSEAWEIPEPGVIPENKVICQGDRLRLYCANTSTGLTIYSALYGRTERGHVICPYQGAKNDQNYNCGETDVTEKLTAMCARKSKCKVKVQSALFGNPCPDRRSYLNLVYACEFQKRKPNVIHLSTSSSTVTKATSTSASTSSLIVALSTTSKVSFSSITISPTLNITATSSSIPLIQSTIHSLNLLTVHTASPKPNDSGVNDAVDTLQVEQAGSTANSGVGSLGIAGALFVWFLFMQDHSSNYITVFFATAAGALSLALIVGLYVLYRHHENKKHLYVKEEPRLSAYGTTDSKTSEDVDPFLLGPVKTPPPDYMLDGYNWNRGGTLPCKSAHNGSLSRTVGSKDVNGPNRPNRYCYVAGGYIK